MMKPVRGTGEARGPSNERRNDGMHGCFTEPMALAGMGEGSARLASACLGHRCLGMSTMERHPRGRETNEQVLMQVVQPREPVECSARGKQTGQPMAVECAVEFTVSCAKGTATAGRVLADEVVVSGRDEVARSGAVEKKQTPRSQDGLQSAAGALVDVGPAAL